MDKISKMLEKTDHPTFYRIQNNLCSDSLHDISESVHRALKRKDTLTRIHPGARVAITAGSRELRYFDTILAVLISELKELGAEPFIIPAMGSHGGATAEGQLEILHNYGISEESMGVPIYSSMDTEEVGRTPNDLAVHADRCALSADYIIPINRIKPHPEFRGDFESGLMKMLAIGLGKQYGAQMCHQLGMSQMSSNVLSFGRVLLKKCSIPFGIGIVENGLHETYSIIAIPAELIEDEEPVLLRKARELVPVIPFNKVDVIICEEMGKEISGTGMDSNVIGRSISLGVSKPFAERIGIFDLTEKSHGNFNGVGLGDAISRRLFEKMSFRETYPNTITACEPFAVKIPPVMDTDRLCLNFSIDTCVNSKDGEIRIVWIKNTLSLDSFYISEALLVEAQKNPSLKCDEQRYSPVFDESDSFVNFNEII